ncbi:MAG: fibrillarin-like rRNA/tRNA 2'-O-methyltransferase [Zestosphaera sp.]
MIEVVNIKPHEKYAGVYLVELEDGSVKLATKNLSPGRRVYGERLYLYEGVEYREWNPYRSKLAGALLKGIEGLVLSPGSKVLYLGAGSGTTPSHVSDLIGEEGSLYAVEFAPRVIRDLLRVCEDRRNMVPILNDARFPQRYSHIVPLVDVLYADVAQPEQAAIVNMNAKYFLRGNGHLYLAIKSRSIDVTKEPDEVYKSEIETLVRGGFDVEDVVHLDPFDKDHAMVLARYKG